MCSFYWSHRLGPLQPVIRLQVLYPLVLALPHPPPVSSQARAGGRPHSSPPCWCQHRGASPRICCVFLSSWPRCPCYRTDSSPLRSFHPSHLQAQRGYNKPYSEMRANCALERWMIPDRLGGLGSDPLLSSPPLRASLPSSPAWSNSPEGALCKTTVVISSNVASQKPSKFLLTPVTMPVFCIFKKRWSHKVQIVFKLSEWQCQTPLTSFLWNLPTNSGDGSRET